MLLVRVTSRTRISFLQLLRYELGCWQSDVYVSKYNIPTSDCATAPNNASIFYLNADAIADYDKRLDHILSYQYTNGTPWSQLSVSYSSAL
jgi:mannan endo-1,4-beta-mannosidase